MSTLPQPTGLLRTILADPSVLKEAAPDETIVLSTVAGDADDHTEIGFLPVRRVSRLGGTTTEDFDYRLVGELGRGGTGIVYQAHQRAVDREVAVKMLRPELATQPHARLRFLTEARVIGGLDHPNVIALHEVCNDGDGGFFYSMKRIDGTSWNHPIASNDESTNVDILLRVADAIRYAHSRGLVHRDIKPENVMLGKFGEVLLADWGLALRPEFDLKNDGTDPIGGTPAYMAPELAGGAADAITPAADIYLLGAILYEVLTGRPPHSGRSLIECIRAAAENVIDPTDVEGELIGIARKAMATRPTDRFDTVDEFIAAIRDQRDHAQSNRLVSRAKRRTANDRGEKRMDDFAVVDALLTEALELWSGNQEATRMRRSLQLDHAAAAAARGDFDLSMTLYRAAGEERSQAAATVRRQWEQRKSSERQASRYSALFTGLPDAGLLLKINSGTIVEANETFEQMFGYTRDEVVGRRIGELNLWVNPARREALVKRIERDRRIDDFEAEFMHTNGGKIDVAISSRVVRVEGVEMQVSTIRDISLRKGAEAELKRNRTRLRDLQRLAGLATWRYDVRTDRVEWSTETFELTGRSQDKGEPTTEEFYASVHPEDRERVKTAIGHAVQSGAAYEVRMRQRHDRGGYIDVTVRGQPIFNDAGETIEVYGVLIPTGDLRPKPLRRVEG